MVGFTGRINPGIASGRVNLLTDREINNVNSLKILIKDLLRMPVYFLAPIILIKFSLYAAINLHPDWSL